MIFYSKFIIEYKGTSYKGFQRQPDFLNTIQGQLEFAFSKIFKEDRIKIVGSGRTDSGVHAKGQVIRIEAPFDIPIQSLIKAGNSLLPMDIRILAGEKCDDAFHPIFSAVSKEYHYYFSGSYLSPQRSDFITSYPFILDVDLIKKGLELFCGEHDFLLFSTKGTDVSTTIRTLISARLEEWEEADLVTGEVLSGYRFIFVGTGFLKQMVRLLVGCLWNLGRGKVTLNDIERGLEGQLSEKLGAVAPPQGLFLKSVCYSRNDL